MVKWQEEKQSGLNEYILAAVLRALAEFPPGEPDSSYLKKTSCAEAEAALQYTMSKIKDLPIKF